MRFALIAVLALGCDSKPAATRMKPVEELAESDRGELIQLRGTVSTIVAHGPREAPHLQFTLSHRGHGVIVVIKGVQPDRFRDGVTARVTGRWTATASVRSDLDREGFNAVSSEDVFLARELSVEAPEF
jgi:cytochrome c-type biogenesis protein CcmE